MPLDPQDYDLLAMILVEGPFNNKRIRVKHFPYRFRAVHPDDIKKICIYAPIYSTENGRVELAERLQDGYLLRWYKYEGLLSEPIDMENPNEKV